MTKYLAVPVIAGTPYSTLCHSCSIPLDTNSGAEFFSLFISVKIFFLDLANWFFHNLYCSLAKLSLGGHFETIICYKVRHQKSGIDLRDPG